MLGKTTREQQEALWDYGFNIGMAFQIVDDLLDFTGEQESLGKPIGGDLREGKVTLPVILLLKRTEPDVFALIQDVVTTRQVTPEVWRTIKDLLARHGAIDAAFERAVGYAERAKHHLTSAFGPSAERDGLVALTDYVLNRDR